MTQRVFDIENEKDMADLWDILPENFDTIRKINRWDIAFLAHGNGELRIPSRFIRIEWHDKTEITRPIQEATEADIGKLCKFWNENEEEYRIAIFTSILDKFNYKYNFCDNTDTYWKHCHRLTKQEVEELC